jgi:hypothetical protein
MDAGDVAGNLLHAHGGFVDVTSDFAGRRPLLLDRRGDDGADVADPFDHFGDTADFLHDFARGRLNASSVNGPATGTAIALFKTGQTSIMAECGYGH